jgi:hypothetical protein
MITKTFFTMKDPDRIAAPIFRDHAPTSELGRRLARRSGWGGGGASVGWRGGRREGEGDVGVEVGWERGWGLVVELGLGVDGQRGAPEPDAPASAQRGIPEPVTPALAPPTAAEGHSHASGYGTLPRVLPRWLETRGAAGVRRVVPPTPERLIRAREDLARRTPASPSDINRLGQERSESPRPAFRATPEPLPSSNRPTPPQSTPTPARTPRPGPGGAWPAHRALRAACPRLRS